jgi:hypothetical protein
VAGDIVGGSHLLGEGGVFPFPWKAPIVEEPVSLDIYWLLASPVVDLVDPSRVHLFFSPPRTVRSSFEETLNDAQVLLLRVLLLRPPGGQQWVWTGHVWLLPHLPFVLPWMVGARLWGKYRM